MDIKSISGLGTTLDLSRAEEKSYKDFKETQQYADEKDDYSFKQVAERKFLGLVNPFIKSIGLTPKDLDFRVKGNQRAVRCEDFGMGDSSCDFNRHTFKHGFKYTPVVVFGLNGSVSVDASYAQAPRSRTTLDIAEDVVNLVYPKSGDGLESPKLEIAGKDSNPKIYVASVAQLEPVLTRLQEVFSVIGDDRLGTLVHLHYEAEEQDKKNQFLAGLNRRTYRDLLETLVR